MKSRLSLESIALKLATLGSIGKNAYGRIFCPLLAVFVVLLGRYAYAISKDIFYISMIIWIVGTILIVNIAIDNMPLERTDQISIQLIPGMAEALLHINLSIKNIFLSFILFSLMNFLIDRLIEKLYQEPGEKVRTEEEFFSDLDSDSGNTKAYALPPNKHRNLYEILMIPIGAGITTSLLMHILSVVTRRI